MQEYNMILEKLNEFYSSYSSIKEKRNILEIKPPLFLDDFNQMTIFISKNQTKINFYTNLMAELEVSLFEKLIDKSLKDNSEKAFKESILSKNIKKQNIIKNYLLNKKEFVELKNNLSNFGIDSNSISLEYTVKNNEKLVEELALYSELLKVFYNNIYHILIEKLSNTFEKNNIFFKNFNKIFEKINNEKMLKEYKKNKISTNPIFYDNKKVLTAAKDFEGLTKLYMDITRIKHNETTEMVGILYYEEPKVSLSKFKNALKDFEGLNLVVKQIQQSDEEYLEKIVIKDLEEIENADPF